MESFTIEQGLRAQAILREKAGLPAESFDKRQIVGMISDEIRELRERGFSDADIAETLQREAQLPIDTEAVGEFYVDTSQFGHGG